MKTTFSLIFCLICATRISWAFVNYELLKDKSSSHSYIRGCYFTNWAQYRSDKGKYTPENYLPGLCTHIFYAFATINQDFTMKAFEWNDETTPGTKGMFERVNDLKKLQPGLKTLLSFGGWTFSEQNKPLLKRLSSTEANRKVFIDSALSYSKLHNFDGFDLDWEYPEADDKVNFAFLLKEMSAAFRKENMLLTAAVAAAPNKIDEGYDVEVLAETLDMVNIMTYDFHGSWEKMTGFNSPLYDRNGDQFSMSSAVEHWASRGLPKSKIIVGLATYGRAWTLSDPSQKTVGAPGTMANAGPLTKEPGFLAFYEICELLANGGKQFFDDVQKVPYLVKGTQWVGYDDLQSFKFKLDWIKKSGFGGAFVWTLDLDDFSGQCPGGSKYPLINAISDALEGVTFTVPSSSSTTTRPQLLVLGTTSSGSGSAFTCAGAGLFPDPNSCFHFFSCDVHGDSHQMACGPGLTFNPKSKVCDWPYNSQCKVQSL